MSFDPEIMERGREFAEFVFNGDKERLMGTDSDADSQGLKCFFFLPRGNVIALPNMDGMVNHDLNIPPKDQMECIQRMFAFGSNSSAAVSGSDVYMADCCPKCGNNEFAGLDRDKDECPSCGTELSSVMPSDNPYASEGIMTILAIRGYNHTMTWLAKSKKQGDKIIGWDDIQKGDGLDMMGRYSDLWNMDLPDWMLPHFAYNLSNIADDVGVEMSVGQREHLEKAKVIIPDDYPLIKIPRPQIFKGTKEPKRRW